MMKVNKTMYVLAFPRDGRPGTNRDGTSRFPFVPGQRDFLVPVSLCPGKGQEQKSRDKLLCPGTSRDKITFPKEHKKQEKDVLKQEKDVLKQEKDVLRQEKDVPKQERTF